MPSYHGVIHRCEADTSVILVYFIVIICMEAWFAITKEHGSPGLQPGEFLPM